MTTPADSTTANEPAKAKPTKPDEEAFKANLAHAEKEHSIVQEKLVCIYVQRFYTNG